jgi:hypothetical protein
MGITLIIFTHQQLCFVLLLTHSGSFHRLLIRKICILNVFVGSKSIPFLIQSFCIGCHIYCLFIYCPTAWSLMPYDLWLPTTTLRVPVYPSQFGLVLFPYSCVGSAVALYSLT